MLSTLAAATIAVPLTQTSVLAATQGADKTVSPPTDPNTAVGAAPAGPSTLSVVTARSAAPSVADGIAAAPVLGRDLSVVSRSQDRGPLPDCNLAADISGNPNTLNGRLKDSQLCALSSRPDLFLSPRAAQAFQALNDAFRAEFGMDLKLDQAYRSIGDQYAIRATRGYLAADPGTSMHGLGLAIDLTTAQVAVKAQYAWLVKNGATYGWVNPSWAKTSKWEPWHFEFMPVVSLIAPPGYF